MTRRPDVLGDRCKAFEAATESTLMPGLPVLVRLDGRAFHTFTRKLERPDTRLVECFHDTVLAIMEDIHADVAYHQSDEITLGWGPQRGDMLFGGRVQKLCSVLAGLTSAAFCSAVLHRFGEDMLARLPHFDCRVWQVPDNMDLVDVFLWREADAVKNSISSLAQEHFSAKELHGQASMDQLAMLGRAGVRWDLLPDHLKRGSYWRRVAVGRTLTADELWRIPEAHRPEPGDIVTRTEIHMLKLPPLNRLANPIGVLLAGDEPTVRVMP